MGFFLLMLMIFLIIIVVRASSGSHGASGYYGGHIADYDDDPEDFEDYEDYETLSARGDREYFSDDPARDYNSYYAQVADDAMMGDEEAIGEMRGEFGEGEW